MPICSAATYGAVGDGVTDNTIALQNWLDACFGTSAAPNGASSWLNQIAYLPPGIFAVVNNCPVTIDRCVSVNGSIVIQHSPRLTVRGSSFGASAGINNPGITAGAVEIEDVMYGGTPNGTPGAILQRQRISSAGTQNYTVM